MVLPRLTVLDGRYAIGRVLETPDPLVVEYQAWNLHTEDQVVLEEFFPSSLVRRAAGSYEVEAFNEIWDELFHYGLKQYLKETEVLSTINHPNLLPVAEHFEANETVYRVLEHHKGATLASVLAKQNDKLPLKTAFTILVPLLEGLQAVHQEGLIHGAFSPKSIFLAKGQGPMLLGFRTTHIMLAQQMGDRDILIEDGISAPEQYEPNGRQGPWTDIYGCAATFVQMITGQALPVATERNGHDGVADVLREAQALPGAVRDLLTQSLSLDASERPRSAQAFRQQLLEAIQEKSTASVALEAEESPAAPATTPEAAAPPEEAPHDDPVGTLPEPVQGVAEQASEDVAEAAPAAVEEEDSVDLEDGLLAFSDDEWMAALAQESAALQVEETGRHAPEEEEPVASIEVEEVEVQETRLPDIASSASTRREEEDDEAARALAAQAAHTQKIQELEESEEPATPVAEDAEPRRRDRRAARKDRKPVRERRRSGPVLAVLALLLVVAVPGAYFWLQAQTGEEASFSQYKIQGDSLFARANYRDAKLQYEQALALVPNNEYVSNRLSETQERLVEVARDRFDEHLTKGDSLYTQADLVLRRGKTEEALSAFSEARAAYEIALAYQPGDPIALEKGQLATKGIEEALSRSQPQTVEEEAQPDPEALRRQLYISYRKQGDDLFEQEAYTEARDKYSRALNEISGDQYAASKIEEIDLLLETARREEQFQALLQQANDLSTEEQYVEARRVFEQALTLKPGNQQALEGINRVDTAVANARRDEQYQQLRAQGDEHFKEEKYAAALASYKEALTFKPEDAYVQQKIQNIEEMLAQQRQAEQAAAGTAAENISENGIYTVVDSPPELIGGLKELHSNVTYPEQAKRHDIEGRVYVQFVVTQDGSVEDARVIRGIGGGCDEEALRVVREARFVPGTFQGRTVKVQHTLFISFKLN